MRSLRVIIPILLFCASAFGQTAQGFDLSNYGVRIEPDRRLIAVLAAIESARTVDGSGRTVKMINTPLSEAGAKFRATLEADTAAMPEELRGRISQFLAAYKKRHPKASDAQIVTPFISMAYTLSSAPELLDPSLTNDLPGELLDVLDFSPLVREFYRRSGISARIDDYVKEYSRTADGVLKTSVRDTVSDTLDYLHTRPQLVYLEKKKTEIQKGKSKNSTLQKTEIIERERRFFVVPEMLTPADSVTFLNIRDDYYVIVPPDKDISASEARRAFIQFIVDPLVIKQAADVAAVKDGIKSLLDERRSQRPEISPDVYRAATRSLVAAVEVRQEEYTALSIATSDAREKLSRANSDSERTAITDELKRIRRTLADETALALSEAYEDGAVMAFYFADALRGTEDSGFDIAASMREMIASFDAAKEKDRLTQFAGARRRAVAAREERKKNPTPASPSNPVTVALTAIDEKIRLKAYADARNGLKELLKANPSDARIYYNLGRVASLEAAGEQDPEAESRKLLEAQAAYSNVLQVRTPSTPRDLLSLTFYALGNLYVHFGQTDYAVRLFDEAIKLDDVPNGAYRDALAAKQRLLSAPK